MATIPKETVMKHIEEGFRNCTKYELFYYLSVMIRNQTEDELKITRTVHRNHLGLSVAHAHRCTEIFKGYTEGMYNPNTHVIVKCAMRTDDMNYLIRILPRYKRQLLE